MLGGREGAGRGRKTRNRSPTFGRGPLIDGRQRCPRTGRGSTTLTAEPASRTWITSLTCFWLSARPPRGELAGTPVWALSLRRCASLRLSRRREWSMSDLDEQDLTGRRNVLEPRNRSRYRGVEARTRACLTSRPRPVEGSLCVLLYQRTSGKLPTPSHRYRQLTKVGSGELAVDGHGGVGAVTGVDQSLFPATRCYIIYIYFRYNMSYSKHRKTTE